jgi:hypothetical protein
MSDLTGAVAGLAEVVWVTGMGIIRISYRPIRNIIGTHNGECEAADNFL